MEPDRGPDLGRTPGRGLPRSPCWLVVPVTLLRLVVVSVSSAGRRRSCVFTAGGLCRIDLDSAAAGAAETGPSLARPLAAERNPAAGSSSLGARRAAADAGARWAVDRPSVRSALDRPRGQGAISARSSASAMSYSPIWCASPAIMSIGRPASTGFAETLGQLAARHGVFFVLGNHDSRVDSAGFAGAGQTGCRSRRPLDSRSRSAAQPVLAGRQRSGRGSAAAADSLETACSASPAPSRPVADCAGPLVPISWPGRRRRNADLLLAGHTHGGQIRIPPLGAIFSPVDPRREVYFAASIYAPPTILHVTRGVSGDIPVRWNCPPEIAHLCLRAENGAARP